VNPAPAAVTVMPGLPAGTEFGTTEVKTGSTASGELPDTTFPGLVTVTANFPESAIRAAGTAAVRLVALR